MTNSSKMSICISDFLFSFAYRCKHFVFLKKKKTSKRYVLINYTLVLRSAFFCSISSCHSKSFFRLDFFFSIFLHFPRSFSAANANVLRATTPRKKNYIFCSMTQGTYHFFLLLSTILVLVFSVLRFAVFLFFLFICRLLAVICCLCVISVRFLSGTLLCLSYPCYLVYDDTS